MPPRHPSLLPTAPRHITLPRTRFFSTTPSFSARPSASYLKHKHRKMAAYPYGPSRTYKQSNFGLYGGSHIQFGNIVSEHQNKSRRTWKPNVHWKRLWSVALNKFVRVRVQANVLRTIDKAGGLDDYLLGDKAARIKELGMAGWALRWKLMNSAAGQARNDKVKEGLEIALMKELVRATEPPAAEEGKLKAKQRVRALAKMERMMKNMMKKKKNGSPAPGDTKRQPGVNMSGGIDSFVDARGKRGEDGGGMR